MYASVAGSAVCVCVRIVVISTEGDLNSGH